MKRTGREWHQIVEDQVASGKSIQEYCEDVGVHPNTFYRKRKAQGALAMVEIRPTPTTEVSALIVNVGRYSVAIQSGFNAQVLKSVLGVLGELQ